MDKIALGGVFPSNHVAIVKPKFAVVESTTDRSHGRDIQAAACIGYAPGGCTIERSENNEITGVSNAPFTYIEPRDPNHEGGTFQPGELGARLREHSGLRIASFSVTFTGTDELTEITDEGIKAVWSAGNDSMVNWREARPWLWDREDHANNPEWDGVLDGDRLLQRIANNDILFVAGYVRDAEGNFIPAPSTTQCDGVDDGCLYAPFVLEFVGNGTSLSAPFVASGLASVLAVFQQTSGEQLIRLAKACAVEESGLQNGLGRFSLSCMDNSSVFFLDQEEEGSATSIQARSSQMLMAFHQTPLPGDSQYTMDVEGVSLVRDMEGSFSHHSGITNIPQYVGRDEEDTMFRVNLFYDGDNQAPGVRLGNREVFLAASWTNSSSFFGYGQYSVESLNVTAGTDTVFLRLSQQAGNKVDRSVVDEVEGGSIGATLTHTFATPMGALTPFVHIDKFTGGSAETPFGTMQLEKSEWNTELGLSTDTKLSEQGSLSVTAIASHRGDLDTEDYGVQAQYRLAF